MANKTIHLGLAASLLLLTQGCFLTRFAEVSYTIGCTRHYTDGSQIKDNAMYRLGDSYYIYAAGVIYKNTPRWYILNRYPYNILEELGYSGQYTLVALAPEAAGYLLTGEIKGQFNPAFSLFEGKACTEAVDLSQAEIITLERCFPSPYIDKMCCGEALRDTVHVRNEKSASSWLAMPLVLLGFATDMTVLVANPPVTIASLPFLLTIYLFMPGKTQESSGEAPGE